MRATATYFTGPVPNRHNTPTPPVRERLPSWVCRRITSSDKLYPFQLDPSLIRSPIEPSMLDDLTQERHNTLCSVFVCVGKVDLIAKEHHPLPELDGGHYNPIGCLTILAIVVKSF